MRIKINDELSMVSVKVAAEKTVETSLPTNHIMVIDCSGSMTNELPRIRSQLKNKLPTLVKEGDTMSLVWFSSRDMFGTLAEKVKVSDLSDLQRLNTAIDRWLKPMALTGFVQPLKEVLKIASTNGGAYSLFFLTDGYDNQWPREDILQAMRGLKDVISNAVLVEYGWNCNRPLMTEMAEEIGGALVFCEGFDAYDPIVASTLSKSIKSAKKVKVDVGNPLHGLVFSVTDNGACSYKVENGAVQVPMDVAEVWMVEEKGIGDPISGIDDAETLRPVYQCAAILSQKMRSKTVRQILAGLGDKRLWKKYANCFGKQNLTDFQTMALDGKVFADGRTADLKVDDDAFTVIDLLFAIVADKENVFIPSKMAYNRIGRATEDAMDDLTDEEREEITSLTAKAKSAKDFDHIQRRMREIQESKPDTVKFVLTDNGEYPVSNLVWNEERPNVSLQIKQQGTVELPDSEFVKSGKVPKNFPTFRYRNYTIVRDGIVNIDLLPLGLSKSTFDLLKGKGVVDGTWKEGEVRMIDLRSLPIINQRMARNISAKELFKMEYELTALKSSQKVYKDFKEKWVGKRTSENFKLICGEEATAWLESLGIKDYSGFNPKRRLADPVDFYMGVEMRVKIKGLSSIPPVKKVMEKLDGKKSLTFSERLLVNAIKDCLEYEKAVADLSDKETRLETWVAAKEKDTVSAVRGMLKRMAEIKFGIIVGQLWFDEFPTIDDHVLTMTFDGEKVDCDVELKPVEIKI